MNDAELLRQYEPVLYFAGADFKERFYPVNVEAYLEQCTLWKSQPGILRWFLRPRDVTQTWDREAMQFLPDEYDTYPGKARAMALKLFDQRHFLRFIKRKKAKLGDKKKEGADSSRGVALVLGCIAVLILPLLGATIWAWLGGITWLACLAGAATGFLITAMLYLFLLPRVDEEQIGSLAGTLFALLLLVAGALAGVAGLPWLAWPLGIIGGVALMGGLMGYIEDRFTADVANFLTLLIGLLIVTIPPLWIAIRSGWGPHLVTPAVLWLLLALFAVAALGGEHGLAAFMAITSPLRRREASQAHKQYQDMRGRHTYYGRVWRDDRSKKAVLQYYLFYAFNDWRYHGGFNFHEGDWEAVFVFLEEQGDDSDPKVEYVGLSQHHQGVHRRWETAKRLPDVKGGTHPVIYVAAGSHANYFHSTDRPLHSLFEEGLGQKTVARVERVREVTVRDIAPSQQRLEAAIQRFGGRALPHSQDQGEGAALQPAPATPPVAARGVEEHPNGRGLILGPEELADEFAGQRFAAWPENPPLLEKVLPAWAEFPGLWGLKTFLRDESGPPGPKWERVPNLFTKLWQTLTGREGHRHRIYWVDPLAWRSKTKDVSHQTMAEEQA